MKKLFLLLSALVIAGLCLSCSKPASNGSGTTGGSTTGEDAGDGDTIVDWEACYLFDTTADMLNYFDMKLEYIDIPSGEVKEVIMTPTATRFAKKAKVTPPLSLGLKLTTTLKTGVSIEDIKAVATIQYVAPTLNYTIIITRKMALSKRWAAYGLSSAQMFLRRKISLESGLPADIRIT